MLARVAARSGRRRDEAELEPPVTRPRVPARSSRYPRVWPGTITSDVTGPADIHPDGTVTCLEAGRQLRGQLRLCLVADAGVDLRGHLRVRVPGQHRCLGNRQSAIVEADPDERVTQVVQAVGLRPLGV
jgi:hypothetical protein